MSQTPYSEPPQQMHRQKSTAPIVVIVLVCALVVLMVCGGILTALLLPAVQSARTAARRMQSTNNLKQIGLALHNYHDAHQAFPPAYATDAEGNPTVSWRVIILPYMGYQGLADQFRMDQPWDSPHNKPLLVQMPIEYRSPLADEESASDTNYFAIVDSEGVFPGAESTRFRDIVDGSSNTVMAVELSNRGAPWSSPADVSAAEALQALQTLQGPAEAGHVLMADGAVNYLDADIDPEVFNAMVTRNAADN